MKMSLNLIPGRKTKLDDTCWYIYL